MFDFKKFNETLSSKIKFYSLLSGKGIREYRNFYIYIYICICIYIYIYTYVLEEFICIYFLYEMDLNLRLSLLIQEKYF